MLVTLRHSLSDVLCKIMNDKYNQQLIKAKAFRDAYNANIEEAENECVRKRQNEHDQILGHLESRALMPPFTSRAHLDMQARRIIYALQNLLIWTLYRAVNALITPHFHAV